MKKIAIITGTRSEYGVLYPLILTLRNSNDFAVSLIVTSMHLSEEFGNTIEEIRENGAKIDAIIDNLGGQDTNLAMAKSIGKCIIGLTDKLEKINPHLLLLIGDRSEMLAGAIVASYINLPIAHISGGDVSGNVDEPVRHAITKLSHLHFPATNKSAERIINMGEERWRVHVVGALGLDSILNKNLIEPDVLAKKYELDISRPILLVVQHPITTDANNAQQQMHETLEAVVELKHQVVLIYPNADAGGRRMIQEIKKYEKYPFIKTFKNLPHREYVSIMNMANVMVGNSSSGIIEAPSFFVPVVNIGNRQFNRERTDNVIDVGNSKNEIIKAIEKSLYDEEYKIKVKNISSPYGDGKTSQRIMNVLKEIKIDNKLLEKRLTFKEGL